MTFTMYPKYRDFVYIIKANKKSNSDNDIIKMRELHSYYIEPDYDYIYYVGHTINMLQRMSEHFRTMKNPPQVLEFYEPKEIIEVVSGSFDMEDKMTLLYMKKYGIENVRGGRWASPKKEIPYKIRNFIVNHTISEIMCMDNIKCVL